jgi:uncharacterized protein (TIGR02266 family)
MPPNETSAGSLESPTMIKVNETGSPVMGIVEEVTSTQIRLRSMSNFKEGDTLSFDLTLRGAPKTPIKGRVTSAGTSGTRKTYVISLKELAHEKQRDVNSALDAAKSFHGRNHHDGEHLGGLTRSSIRVPVEMDVQFSHDGVVDTGRSTNISTGGLLMNFGKAIPIGTSVEVMFTLPGQPRELKAHARIIAHQQQTPNYNVAFHSIDDAVRTAIAQFVALKEQ